MIIHFRQYIHNVIPRVLCVVIMLRCVTLIIILIRHINLYLRICIDLFNVNPYAPLMIDRILNLNLNRNLSSVAYLNLEQYLDCCLYSHLGL